MVLVEVPLRDLLGDPFDDTISCKFDEKELALLRDFVALVDRLRITRLLKFGLPRVRSISWEADTGLRFQCAPYENSDLYELLHVLRPLILEKEATSFHRVADLFGKKLAHGVFRKHLRHLRKAFENGECSLSMAFKIQDKNLFDGASLKLWLNGKQYHTDEEKAAEWEELERSLGCENARAFLITQLCDKVRAIFALESLAQMVLSRSARVESTEIAAEVRFVDDAAINAAGNKEEP